MSCFNCYRKIKKAEYTIRYRKPYQLTRKLQDRKWTEGSYKPDFSILEALENILDGEVSLDRLKKHSAQYLCHECQVYLRQAVNKKSEVEHHIEILNDHVSKVTNEERRHYYKENYGVDKTGRCWACMYKFVPLDYQKKKHTQRFNMKTLIVEEMSAGEAVNSLLEDQAETLIGLYWKKTYICCQCVSLLKNVIKTQCLFETLNTSFSKLTNPSSILARLQAGEEVLNVTDSCSERLEHSSVDTDQDEDLASNSSSMKGVQNKITTSEKSLGNITGAKLVSQASTGKRKHSEIEDFDPHAENDAEDESDDSNEMVINSDSGENTESLDAFPQEGGSEPSGSYELYDEVNNERIGKTSAGDNSDVEKANKELNVTKDSNDGDNVKCKMQIKLSLKGTKIKEASVLEVSSKKTKLMTKDSTVEQNVESRTMSDQWKIYYYPVFAGRAEFIRLVFEEAGVEYAESTEDFPELRRLIIDGEMEGYPHFAPPVVTKGSLQVSQTPVICRYLGEQFGLYPDTEEDKLHAEQINQCCHDYIAEGRLAFHGVAPVGSYASQKEATQPYIDRFVNERMPRWLKYFERVLGANNQGKGFLYGDKISYADLALFHVIHATEAQFSDSYTKADYIPKIKAFKDRIASRPNIAKYLKSDRWKKFCGDSMM